MDGFPELDDEHGVMNVSKLIRSWEPPVSTA